MNCIIIRRQNSTNAGLKEICLLFHVIPLPEWKFVKLLNRHAKYIKEGIRRQVTLQRKARQRLLSMLKQSVFMFYSNSRFSLKVNNSNDCDQSSKSSHVRKKMSLPYLQSCPVNLSGKFHSSPVSHHQHLIWINLDIRQKSRDKGFTQT